MKYLRGAIWDQMTLREKLWHWRIPRVSWLYPLRPIAMMLGANRNNTRAVMKLMVIGYGRHGKDTVCEVIGNLLNLRWASSSWLMAERVVFPILAPKYGYETVQECFDDRANHRAEWFDAIAAYNQGNPARFAAEVYKDYDIYCGLRNHHELVAAKGAGLIDLTIWVDALDRLPPEPASSCTVSRADADIIIDNNGTEAQLVGRVANLCRLLTSLQSGPFLPFRR